MTRNKLRAAKWHAIGQHKIARGCEAADCPLPEGFDFRAVDLDFDHLHDKRMNVSNMIRSDYGWAAVLEEIAKCRVLCKICHARHSARQRA